MAKPTEALPLPLLDEVGAQKHFGINRYQLRALRRARSGPTIVKLGRSVRYRPEDLASWIAANRVAPADLPPPKRKAVSK